MIEGVKVDQLSSKNHPFILGEGGFVKGFEEKLVGLKKGQKKLFSLKIGKDHQNKEFAGKKVDFKIRVNRLKKVILPTIKELARKLGSKNEAEFKMKFKKAQEKQKQDQAEKRFESRLIAELVKKTKLDLPKSLVKQELRRISSLQDSQFAQQGITKEQFLKNAKIKEKDYNNDLKKAAENNVRIALIMNRLAKEEKIEPKKKSLN